MTVSPSPFRIAAPTPYYPGHGLFLLRASAAVAWEFNGWKRESLSWKRSCYIHGGLSGPGSQIRYEGPDAERFLASICVNNFSKFKVGAAKHAIMCTEDGLVAAHGVLQRMSPDAFRLFASGPWAAYRHGMTDLDVEQTIEDRYLFQVAGPGSLDVLEAATGESLRDIGFLRYRDSTIAGRTVQIMRIGMAGTLAYELHGPTDEGPEVYDAVFRAGEPFGIERLGWQTYTVNHVEGGFPQANWTFLGAAHEDPGFLEFVKKGYVRWMPADFTGSVDPADRRARYRTPTEVGWESSVRFDHDFLGRAALEREAADPKRTVVTLEWNSQDVVDVYASLFEEGEEYQYFEMPTTPHFRRTVAHADSVLAGGKEVGIASGTAYSYHFRKMLSLCTIDRDQAGIGNEVVVRWGNHGGRIKDIRARVARFPYLTEGRNQGVDVATRSAPT
jgi:glycine cleavage system aminomethyltransferase T